MKCRVFPLRLVVIGWNWSALKEIGPYSIITIISRKYLIISIGDSGHSTYHLLEHQKYDTDTKNINYSSRREDISLGVEWFMIIYAEENQYHRVSRCIAFPPKSPILPSEPSINWSRLKIILFTSPGLLSAQSTAGPPMRRRNTEVVNMWYSRRLKGDKSFSQNSLMTSAMPELVNCRHWYFDLSSLYVSLSSLLIERADAAHLNGEETSDGNGICRSFRRYCSIIDVAESVDFRRDESISKLCDIALISYGGAGWWREASRRPIASSRPALVLLFMASAAIWRFPIENIFIHLPRNERRSAKRHAVTAWRCSLRSAWRVMQAFLSKMLLSAFDKMMIFGSPNKASIMPPNSIISWSKIMLAKRAMGLYQISCRFALPSNIIGFSFQ